MTQSEWDELPMLLSPHHVYAVSGLAWNGLKVLREEHPEIVAHKCGKGKYMYSKRELAKLFKFKMD